MSASPPTSDISLRTANRRFGPLCDIGLLHSITSAAGGVGFFDSSRVKEKTGSRAILASSDMRSCFASPNRGQITRNMSSEQKLNFFGAQTLAKYLDAKIAIHDIRRGAQLIVMPSNTMWPLLST